MTAMSARVDDGFERLLGPGRGATDPRLREDLVVAERELGAARRELAALSHSQRTLRQENADLFARIANLDAVVERKDLDIADLGHDRDHARYMMLRAGGRDPLRALAEDHQGEWSTGRPFLSGQHAFAADSGDCYVAADGGVPAGRRPGTSTRWRRCPTFHRFPAPPPLPDVSVNHPASSGLALRQGYWWWDVDYKRWSIQATGDLTVPALSREHLLGVLVWLERMLPDLWQAEVAREPLLVPNPVNAYENAEEFLHDTILWRALVEEKRRRRIRYGPGQRQRAENENDTLEWRDVRLLD